MAAIALSSLRSRVAARAAVVIGAGLRHEPSTVNGYINEALEEYHLVLTDAGHPQRETRTTLTTTTGTTLVDGWPANQFVELPADFLQLRGVSIDTGSTQIPLRPFTEREVSVDVGWTLAPAGQPERFRVSRNDDGEYILRLLPPSNSAYTLVVVYTPTITQLSADGDTFNFFPGTAEFVVCDAALKVLEDDGVQEGNQYQAIMARRERAASRLALFARKSNRAGPSGMIDVRRNVRRATGGYLA